MILLRPRLSALAGIALVTVFASQIVLSGTSAHTMCAAAKHDCGSTARIAACCCAGDTEASHAAGPIVVAVRISPPTAWIAAPAPRLAVPPMTPSLTLTAMSAAMVPDDLTILLSNLRV